MRLIPCIPIKELELQHLYNLSDMKVLFDYRDDAYWIDTYSPNIKSAREASWVGWLLKQDAYLIANFVRWREENATYLEVCK